MLSMTKMFDKKYQLDEMDHFNNQLEQIWNK